MDVLDTAIKYMEGLEFNRCCSGNECGCLGVPIDPEYYVLRDMLDAKNLITQLQQKLEIAKTALNELGHYGIPLEPDGQPYSCNVAQVAQEALKELGEME